MSSTDLKNVIERAISDAEFRRQLHTDAKSALAGFSLTSAESAAIGSGDPTRLSDLGVDQRMSKVFIVLGPGGTQAATSGSDLGSSQTSLSDENPSRAQDALVTGTAVTIGSGIVGDPTSTHTALLNLNTSAYPDDALATGDQVDDSGSNAMIDPGTLSRQPIIQSPDAVDRHQELLASMNDTNAQAMAAGRDGSLAGPSGADTFRAAPVEGSPEAAVIDAGGTGAQSSLAAANAPWPDDALIGGSSQGGSASLADANAAWPDDALATGALDDSGTNANVDPGSVDASSVADMPGPGVADS